MNFSPVHFTVFLIFTDFCFWNVGLNFSFSFFCFQQISVFGRTCFFGQISTFSHEISVLKINVGARFQFRHLLFSTNFCFRQHLFFFSTEFSLSGLRFQFQLVNFWCFSVVGKFRFQFDVSLHITVQVNGCSGINPLDFSLGEYIPTSSFWLEMKCF